LVPPPQQLWSFAHQVPVIRQPSASWQTVTPEPGSTHVREQQVLPFVHGSPAWVQPLAPPPFTVWHIPTPPLVAVQAELQHSLSLRQTSPMAWHE
jgi:hypothetical protein